MRFYILLFVLALFSAPVADAQGVNEFCARYAPDKGLVAADIGGQFGQDILHVPLTLDLQEAFGIALPVGMEGEPKVASFDIYSDGRVFYEGQDISVQANALCSGEEFEPVKSTTSLTRERRVIEPVEQEELEPLSPPSEQETKSMQDIQVQEDNAIEGQSNE